VIPFGVDTDGPPWMEKKHKEGYLWNGWNLILTLPLPFEYSDKMIPANIQMYNTKKVKRKSDIFGEIV
jgi:hypothetical protein